MSGCGERETNRMLAPWLGSSGPACMPRAVPRGTRARREPHVIAHPHSQRCPVDQSPVPATKNLDCQRTPVLCGLLPCSARGCCIARLQQQLLPLPQPSATAPGANRHRPARSPPKYTSTIYECYHPMHLILRRQLFTHVDLPDKVSHLSHDGAWEE